MNTYDQLTYIILNRILSCFGIRILGGEKIKYIYRITDYTDPEKKEVVKIIALSSDVEDAFSFLKMDYANYKKQQFNTIFEYVEWMTKRCRYLTVDIIKSLAKDVNVISENERTDVQQALSRFCDSVKIGHIVLRDFQYAPIIMYPNLRESIVRSYFNSEEIDNQFINIKLTYLCEKELPFKFSPLLIVNWIEALKSDSKLTGLFTTSFVNYITKNDQTKFPRFLIDHDVNIIRKEVLSYYYNIFPHTQVYRNYILSKKEKNEVDQ